MSMLTPPGMGGEVPHHGGQIPADAPSPTAAAGSCSRSSPPSPRSAWSAGARCSSSTSSPAAASKASAAGPRARLRVQGRARSAPRAPSARPLPEAGPDHRQRLQRHPPRRSRQEHRRRAEEARLQDRRGGQRARGVRQEGQGHRDTARPRVRPRQPRCPSSPPSSAGAERRTDATRKGADVDLIIGTASRTSRPKAAADKALAALANPSRRPALDRRLLEHARRAPWTRAIRRHGPPSRHIRCWATRC